MEDDTAIEDLRDKLVRLERQKKEVKQQKKAAMNSFRDQLKEIDEEIDTILDELENTGA